MTQISHSGASGHNVNSSAAARYFEHKSAVALRNLVAAYGTDMPRYLLVPEVAVLLLKVTDLLKRLFIDTLWNTGGRLNEILPLTRGDFVLEDPLSAAPLVSPFVVLRTLKQRWLEESVGSRSRRRGRPTKEEQQAQQEAQADIRDNPPRAVPLTDPAFVQRLRVAGTNQILPRAREPATYSLFRVDGGRSLRRLRLRNDQCVLPSTL